MHTFCIPKLDLWEKILSIWYKNVQFWDHLILLHKYLTSLKCLSICLSVELWRNQNYFHNIHDDYYLWKSYVLEFVFGCIAEIIFNVLYYQLNCSQVIMVHLFCSFILLQRKPKKLYPIKSVLYT